MNHKGVNGYESILKTRRFHGWVPTLSLLDEAYLEISGHSMPRDWRRNRTDLACLRRSQIRFESQKYGLGRVRFILTKDRKTYLDWLLQNLPEVLLISTDQEIRMRPDRLLSSSVQDDVALITSFRLQPEQVIQQVEVREVGVQQTIQEIEVQQAIPEPAAAPVEKGIERLRDLLAESQKGVLNRIESLVDLVEAQQSALKQQSLTIEALKDQVGLLAARQTQTATSPVAPRPSLIERLFS